MIIKCKMCGGDIEFTPGATYGTCEYCGSISTIPQAEDETKLNRYNRANHFRRQCEFDKALAAYEKLLEQDDADAEAHWGAVISRYGIEYVEDPATGRRVPTCHRVQVASILADADYLAAVENAPDAESRRLYETQAAEIAEIQKGILAISANEKPYDVFICYKETDESGQRTRDSQWAQEVYYGLTEQGYKVFFSRITLEDKLGQQYEPYIFAALNSAKVMVVIGSRPEHFNAVWVKNEWSRFLALMAKDRKRLLIPCYRGMDPYDLPEELSALQSQDMSKIGFMQDLLRGIRKVLDAEKKPEQPQVIVQQAAPAAAPGADANLTALLKRGDMALADGEWKKADEFFEKALNLNAEVPEAYMGKFLAGNKAPSIEAWAQGYCSAAAEGIRPDTLTLEITDAEKAHVEQMVQRCVVTDYLNAEDVRTLYEVDRTYASTMAAWQAAHDGMLRQLKNRNLVRALQFATGALKARYEAAINGLTGQLEAQPEAARLADEESVRRLREEAAAAFARADAEAERLHADALDRLARHQAYVYEQACKQMEEAARLRSARTYEAAASAFEELGSYGDSEQKRAACLQTAEQIRQAELEAQDKARKRKRLMIAIVSAAVVLVVALSLLITKVIIPGNHYKEAEALLAAGEYDAASEAFAALENYKDAADRVLEPYYVQAEALLADGDQDGAAEAFARAAGYQDALTRYYNMKYAQGEGSIAAGDYHTVGLKRDGSVVAVGSNGYGRCDVSGWTDIVAVAAGYYHTVGLKRDGSVVAVGYNEYGQCDVSGWTDIVAVAAGTRHTVGLKRDGSVVAVGSNKDINKNLVGQCDVGGWTDIVAVAAGSWHTVGLKRDGSVVAVGDNDDGQCDVGGWTDIVAVAAGDDHTVGLKRDGSVVAVGYNGWGQCDVGGWTDIVAVAAGEYHTVGLKRDGSVVAVGYNNHSQCDVSDWTDIVIIAVGPYHTVGLKQNGSVVAVGRNDDGQCNVSGWTDIGGTLTLE
ncbi:MAG: TIR domain-containing protein [Aristaeellaceae bacterium]